MNTANAHKKELADYVFGKTAGYVLGTLALGGAMLFIALHIAALIKEVLL